MDKIQKGDSLSQSKDLIQENIDKLKQLFPEIVTEDKIDFKVLQDLLGDEMEVGEEYYRFTWAGKAQARREAHKPSTGTLRPTKDESVNWDSTQNLYIEGDNLEVLKLLQKSYASKVKMIYIDPPYNTGKDFVYKDNYKDNLRNYQEQTGQIDSEGNRLSTNTDSDGRYHSNWLNMMYPRLVLARNLLKDDGVIFMSIDDNEVENLRKIGNDVFGEDNFVANVIWEKKYSPQNDAKWFSDNHDYILVFSKNKNLWHPYLLPRTNEQNNRYKNPDNDPRGNWKTSDLSVKRVTEKDIYEITTPSGRVVFPPKGRSWAVSFSRFNELLKDNRIWFGANENAIPQLKRFITDVKDGIVPLTLWKYKDVGHNQEGKQELNSLFDIATFDTPKVVRLLKRILHLSSSKNDIILDFFSGSATTAHAVMQLNAEDGGTRKHIQVQLPEPTDKKSEAYKAGYNTIADIGKERIRRAGKKILEEKQQELAKLKADKNLFDENKDKIAALEQSIKNLDIGFKVFKLDSSNIKAWDGSTDNLEQQLFDAVHNIKEDRSEDDVLYEILLKYGLDLTLPIEERIIEGKTVFNVGYGALFICLGNVITSKVAEGIGTWKDELNPEVCRVIFKDSGFTDVEKTNSIQVLKRFGIDEVKSI